MKRSAASIVYLVNIHIFQLNEVVKWRRLVSLRTNMKHVGPVHIFSLKVRVHLLNKYSYQFVVAVIRSEVQCCKLFIGLLIGPRLQRLNSWFFIKT